MVAVAKSTDEVGLLEDRDDAVGIHNKSGLNYLCLGPC